MRRGFGEQSVPQRLGEGGGGENAHVDSGALSEMVMPTPEPSKDYIVKQGAAGLLLREMSRAVC